jgi:hypothetical protein
MARLAASNSGSAQRSGIILSAEQVVISLSDALSMIERVSQMLRRLSYLAVSATTISLGVMFWVLLVGWKWEWFGTDWLAIVSLSFGSVALYGCASHEIWRKRGEVLFEEISDEVERRTVMIARDPKFEEEKPGLLLRARLALRDFAHASDLPFIPGKFGPTIYAAVNLLIPILILFSSRLLKP